MSASDHLNNEQTRYYHGSSVALNVGDVIVPATQAGHTPYDKMYREYDSDPKHREQGRSRGDHVFMSPNEEDAWHWTTTGSEDEWSVAGHPTPWVNRSKRVYEVEPIGGAHKPHEIGVPGGTLISNEMVTQRGMGARVVGENVTPPPGYHASSHGLGDKHGVQGQIPNYNWDAQHADERGRQSNARSYPMSRELSVIRNNETMKSDRIYRGEYETRKRQYANPKQPPLPFPESGR